MKFILQPTIQNAVIRIEPLLDLHFDTLYSIASDPLIWEQHPNKDRYKKDVFEKFFKDGMLSGGAFVVIDVECNEIIGSSRYYDLDEEAETVAIGFTFLARRYWGHRYNRPLKDLMLRHAFQFVDRVIFHIGANNIRSQTAIGKLGAKKIGEQKIDFPGEPNPLNFVYEIKKDEWK